MAAAAKVRKGDLGGLSVPWTWIWLSGPPFVSLFPLGDFSLGLVFLTPRSRDRPVPFCVSLSTEFEGILSTAAPLKHRGRWALLNAHFVS